jgi:nucleoside 2-deoxyribosyltransferase
LVDELNASISGRRTLTLREGDLWPTSPEEYDEMLCGPQVHYRNGHGSPNGPNGELPQPWELQLSAAEVQLAIEEKKLWAGSDKGGEIDNQIAQRDYRLIDQVDCVVIYRPSMRKRGWDLGGTRLEYMHAVETGKPVLVIRDKIDGPLEKPPFNTGVNPFNILEWQHLDTNKDEQMNCFVEAEKRIKTNISKTFSGL